LGDGTKQAKETLLTSEDQLNAKDALGVVIINRVVPNNTVFEASMSVAKSMATAFERSICFTKRVINEIYETMSFIRALNPLSTSMFYSTSPPTL
jgi:enoyl-CoA hydratase/carnithine racemase